MNRKCNIVHLNRVFGPMMSSSIFFLNVSVEVKGDIVCPVGDFTGRASGGCDWAWAWGVRAKGVAGRGAIRCIEHVRQVHRGKSSRRTRGKIEGAIALETKSRRTRGGGEGRTVSKEVERTKVNGETADVFTAIVEPRLGCSTGGSQ